MASAAELAIALKLTGASQTSSGLKDVGGSADGLGSKLGTLGKAAAVAGTALAVGLAAGLVSCVKEAAASEQVMAQTEAVIKSTGGAAGLSAQQVADMAGSLSRVAPFDDEVIQQAENLLLTFTNIGGDVMPQATQAVLDMSTALGQDTASSAQQLGKALQDPIQGVTALQRVGVKLTDAQKEQVKAMVEAGDVAGAQGVILQELQKEFGGSATAAGKTFAGQLKIAQTQIGNLKESIGAALIPVLVRLLPYLIQAADWLGAHLPAAIALVSNVVGGLIERLAGPLTAAFVFVRDAVLTFVQALQGDWVSASGINPIHDAIGKLGLIIREDVIPAVMSMAAFFTGTIVPAAQQVFGVIQQVVGAFQGEGGLAGAVQRLSEILGPVAEQLLAWAGQVLVMLVNQVGTWAGALIDWIAPQIPPLLVELGKIALAIGDWAVQTALPAIAAQLAVWGQALIDWIGPRIPPMLAALGDLLLKLGVWAKDTGLPMLAAKLSEWGAALIDWVQPQIVPLLAELGKLLLQVGNWLIDTGIPALTAKLGEWGAAFIAWVKPQIPPLLKELGSLLASLGDWLLTTALPEILSKLAEWAAAFVAWVAPQIPPLLSELGSLLGSLGDWLLTTALPEIITKLGEWAAAFIKWVAPQIPPLLIELGSLLIALGKWVLETALPEVVKYVAKWGEAFVKWVATDVLPKLPGALGDILTTIGGWVLGSIGWVLGEAAKIGAAIVDGAKQGVKDAAQGLADAALQVVKDALDGVKSFLGISSPSKLMHDEVGIPISDGIAAGILAGMPAVLDALGTVASTISNYAMPAPLPGYGTAGAPLPPPATNPWDNLTSNPVQPPATTPTGPTATLPPYVDDPFSNPQNSVTGGAYQGGGNGGGGYGYINTGNGYHKIMSGRQSVVLVANGRVLAEVVGDEQAGLAGMHHT